MSDDSFITSYFPEEETVLLRKGFSLTSIIPEINKSSATGQVRAKFRRAVVFFLVEGDKYKNAKGDKTKIKTKLN